MGDPWLFCIFMVCDKMALTPKSEAGGRYILDFQSTTDWDWKIHWRLDLKCRPSETRVSLSAGCHVQSFPPPRGKKGLFRLKEKRITREPALTRRKSTTRLI